MAKEDSKVATLLTSQDFEQIPELLRAGLERQWQMFTENAAEKSVELSLTDELRSSLCRVWASSEFVAQSCARDPAMLADLIQRGDLTRAYSSHTYKELIESSLTGVYDDASLGVALRRFRRREMVRIAWRDIAGWAELDEVLGDLSALASVCVDEALTLLHQWQATEFGMPHGGESDQPQSLVVLGMGKLGAGELNYSSDIDLIFAYPERGETRGGRAAYSNEEYFVRLGRRLIAVINQPTAEGFVFRVDMRLRPFGDVGPLAISFDAMEEYYQVHGREWERYAMIKAAVIAGDTEAGAELMEILRPFVYRRYLDYGAFESLREMKAMIGREVRRKGMEDNVKLGPGGIREVEFIGQALQLIRGGREKALQIRPILKVLDLLASLDYMPEYVVKALAKAYVFLRKAENRIQAIADQQTHLLPKDDVNRMRLAFAMGYSDWSAFERDLRRQMTVVHEHFEQVFAAPQREQAAEQGSVYDGVWRDGARESAVATVVETLEQQGFDRPEEVAQLLKRLREGFSYRTMSIQGKDRLDRLMPLLLGAVVLTEQPADVFARLVSLIEAIARRTAYLALLVENPMALSQLVKLCAASPWIASHLARYPVLLDELLDARSLYAPLDRQGLEAELTALLAQVDDGDLEQQMEVLRHFKQANVLRVAAADVIGVYPLMVVSDHLTEIAEVVLKAVVHMAYDHLVVKHGRPQCEIEGQQQEPGFVVVAYGKMGGIELGYGSDLDLVFLHGHQGSGATDSEKAGIDNAVFFARLGQRIIHLMTTHTPAGVLYEVDARLRPSGAAGLLVSSMDGFAKYQQDEAWTWEHQALVRARVVVGDQVLASRFDEVRRAVLGRPRDGAALQTEVREMRERMRQELSKKRDGLFDLKQDAGGIADIEFIVQYAVLRWACDHPRLLAWTDNIRLLGVLADEGLLPEIDAQALADAYRAYRAVVHRQALQSAEAVAPEEDFTEYRQNVLRIWHDLLETVK